MWVKEIKRKLNENANTARQNSWDDTKAVFRGKL